MLSSSTGSQDLEDCVVTVNAATARALHQHSSYDTYSCATQNARDHEVHVLAMYQPTWWGTAATHGGRGSGGEREFCLIWSSCDVTTVYVINCWSNSSNIIGHFVAE